MKNSNLITKVNSIEDLISLWYSIINVSVNISERDSELDSEKEFFKALKQASEEIMFPSLRDEDSEYSKFMLKIYSDVSSENIIRMQDINTILLNEYTKEELEFEDKMKEYMTTIPFMMEIDAGMQARIDSILEVTN